MLFYATTIDGLQMGLCFAVLALGVYISYAILDFPDLSVDGTFPLGGVCAAIFMLKFNMPPLLAILPAFLIGALAGTLTGVLHVKFNISKILAGIITMTALLSITLALTKLLTSNGQTTTIFSFRSKQIEGLFGAEWIENLGADAKDYIIMAILLLFVIAVKILMDLFLKTKLGYMLKATGSNEKLVTTLGKNVGSYKILGLAIANGLVSVSGALYANLYTQYDNTCGSGKVVMALAAVIIGMTVFSKIKFFKDTTAVIFGALIYSLCLNYLVLVDTNGIYLKLLNAVLFALILISNQKLSSFLNRKTQKKGAGAK